MEEIRLGNLYGDNKGTGYAGNVWDKEGICPALTTMQGGGREPMITEINILGNMNGHQSGSIYSTDGIAPTLPAFTHGYALGGIVEQEIVAMRGRDPLNPSDRTKGNHNLEQRLEPNSEGICNTLTTVQKDNLVLVKQATKVGATPCLLGGGGRFELSNESNQKGKGDRSGNDKSNTNNGEYP